MECMLSQGSGAVLPLALKVHDIHRGADQSMVRTCLGQRNSCRCSTSGRRTLATCSAPGRWLLPPAHPPGNKEELGIPVRTGPPYIYVRRRDPGPAPTVGPLTSRPDRHSHSYHYGIWLWR